MKIIVARNAGFCFGVRRAVESIYECLDLCDKIYTLGPVIHNPQVVEELNKKGVKVEEKIEDITSGTVVVRSHGIGKGVYDKLSENGINVIDATCPFVKRIHHLVKNYYSKGYDIIIAGEKKHPEVVGINGWCDYKAFIVNNTEDAEDIPKLKKACIVAQTTITRDKWDEIIKIVKNRVDQLEIFNTICHTTSERQKEAESIAKSVDVMWVIGGRNSSNTRKLYDICKSHCDRTFAIETAKDINVNVIDPGDAVGITAGASTPDWIIKEVVKTMSELEEKNLEEKKLEESETINSNATQQEPEQQPQEVNESEPNAQGESEPSGELTTMEGFEDTMVTLRAGQIIKGTVLKAGEDEIIVNIGYKSDGILPIGELSVDDDRPISELISEGDEIEVEVAKVNDGEGNVLLSRKSIEQRVLWKEIEEGFKSEKEFEGSCVEAVKGGVIAKIKNIRAFVPASQISTRYIEDLNSVVGKQMRLRIIEIEKGRKRVVASQRAILEAEEVQKKQELLDSLEEGQTINGVVKRLTNFGAFVDIGGVDGLIHISDLSWGRIDHPREVVEEEQPIEVIVLAVDKERERISLGYKQTLPHPWDNVDNKYPAGSIVTGKVVRITSFGAFVELEPGVDGLVHISQIANRRIDKVEDVLEVGQEVQAKVLDVKPDAHRISLSIREAISEEKREHRTSDRPSKKQEFKKEEMTVSLGEFFPDNLNDRD